MLGDGEISDRTEFLAQFAIFCVSCKSDDLEYGFRPAGIGGHVEGAANRIRASEVFEREHLVHDGDLRRRKRVMLSKLPASQQARPHKPEKTWPGFIEEGRLIPSRRGFAVGTDQIIPGAVAHRGERDLSYRSYPWNCR